MGIAIIVPNVSFASNNIGKVTLSSNGGGSDVIDVTAITISGPSIVNTDSNIATYSVNYTPSNTTQKGIKWSIENGSDYASISQDGTLTVKKSGSVTIKATSIYNPSIIATKTISVTFVGQGTDIPTHKELAYIGTEGGNYLKTNTIYAADGGKVKTKVNLPVVTHSTNTRQFILHDEKNVNIANNYGSKNTFYASLTKVTIFFNGIQNGICELECSRYTHNLTNNGSNVVVKSQTNVNVTDTGLIHLFASPATTRFDNKRVDIYYFKFIVNDVEQLSLVPVLKDGKPCFFDEISKTYLFITGNKNIYYATKDNPTNELTYNG